MKNIFRKIIALVICLLTAFTAVLATGCNCGGNNGDDKKQFTGLALDDVTVTCDGAYHNVVVTGLDAYPGATVIYYYDDEEDENNLGKKKEGTYDALAIVSLSGYDDAYLEATLKINPKPKPKEFTGLTMADNSVPYDGELHKLKIEGIDKYPSASVEFKYNGIIANDGVSEQGTYPVIATVSQEGYNNKVLNGTLTITEPEDPDANKKVIILNDYENHKDLDTMALIGYLGKATLNSDKTYVTSGEKSLKLTVDHDTRLSGTPGIYQNTTLTVKKKDYSNFNYTSAFSLDVYNVQDVDTTLKIKLVYELIGYTYTLYKTEVEKSFTLKANQWTRVQYDVAREYIPIKEGSSYVKAIEFFFDRDTTKDTYYYIDQLTLYKTSIGFNAIDKTLSYGVPAGDGTVVDEICSFDYEWQIKALEFEGTDPHHVSISKEFTADGRGSALRIDTVDSSSWTSFPSVKISSGIWGRLNWYVYDADDELVFDYYVPGDGWESVGISMSAGYRFYSHSQMLERNEWHEVRIKVGDILEYLEATTNYYLGRMRHISISFGRQMPGYSRTLYVDNLRMVRHGSNAN